MKNINKCICFDITFEKILEHSKTLSYDELIRSFGCGTKCGLCKPYIHEAIATGLTSFQPKV